MRRDMGRNSTTKTNNSGWVVATNLNNNLKKLPPANVRRARV
jgi:hypothetical protein